MFEERKPSKAMYLPELEPPVKVNSKESFSTESILDWIRRIDGGEDWVIPAKLTQWVLPALVTVGMLAALFQV